MIINKNSLIDGQTSFELGVHTGTSPWRVPRNQSCLLINNTTRNDDISPRSRWKQIALTFDSDEDRAAFENGYFQGFSGYIPDYNPAQLVWSISGKIFSVQPLGGGIVTLLSPVADPNPTNRLQAWFEQAELFLVIQDGQSAPWIYDGASLVRSNVLGTSGTDDDGTPLYEVPVGTIMCYDGGRLWVVLPNEVQFVAGDGVYGPTGTPAYQQRDSVLRFTENAYLASGFPFAVPANLGRITAIQPVANLDTSLGQGPMQVFTSSGAFSIQAPFDRALWALMTDPIKTKSLLAYGFLADASTINVNGDLWGRALNGIRSFIIARRDFGTWGNRAMSHEVERHLERDDQELLRYGSAALFDDRLLMTTTPQQDALHGVYHKGLVALDFHPLTAIAKVEQPTWDGLWTGLDILQIVTVTNRGIDHCYAAVLAQPNEDGDRKIQLWELTRDRGPDVNASGFESRIQRAIESPRFDFSPSNSNRLEQKLLESADIWINNVSGIVDFRLYFRPDEYPCWIFWKHWQVCARTTRCQDDAVDGCVGSLNLKPQFRPRIGATRPPDFIIDAINQPARMGYGFQYRLEIVGDADLTAIRLLACRVIEATFGADQPESATCVEFVCCNTEDYLPDVPPSTGADAGTGGGGNPTPPPPPTPPTPPEPPTPPPPSTISGPVWPVVHLEGSSSWQPMYEQPGGATRPLGYEPIGDPPSELPPEILASWTAYIQEQWNIYKATNGITTTAEQMEWVYSPGDVQLRYNPIDIFSGAPNYATAAWKMEVWLFYTI